MNFAVFINLRMLGRVQPDGRSIGQGGSGGRRLAAKMGPDVEIPDMGNMDSSDIRDIRSILLFALQANELMQDNFASWTKTSE